MKKAILVFVAVSFLLAASSVLGQEEGEGVENYVAAEVPEIVMKGVVRRMVASYFKPSNTPQKVYFSDRLIRKEWLPEIKNIEFVVLSDEERAKLGVKVNFFASVEESEGKFRVKYGVGDPGCSASGHIWYFWVWGNQLRLWKSENEGWGSGCGSGNGTGH